MLAAVVVLSLLLMGTLGYLAKIRPQIRRLKRPVHYEVQERPVKRMRAECVVDRYQWLKVPRRHIISDVRHTLCEQLATHMLETAEIRRSDQPDGGVRFEVELAIAE